MRDFSNSLVLSVSASPGIQRTMVIHEFIKDEVMRARATWLDAGGKGASVSRVLRQLGIPVKYLCQGGTNQDEYAGLLDHDGFPYHLTPSRSKIRHCTTILEIEGSISEADARVASVSELIEPSGEVDSITESELYKTVLAGLVESSVLVISGSMAPGFRPEFYADLVREAKSMGRFVILDIRGDELLHAFEFQPHVVKINISEFARTFLPEKAGFIEHCETAHTDSHKDIVAETLMDLTEDSPTSFIVTRGPRTVWYGWQGSFYEYTLPTIAKSKILNPIGSGDAFTAGMAAWIHAHITPECIEHGLGNGSLEEAMALGVRCAQENARLLRPGRIR